ncbi:MAG: YeeE/YedE family protein [Planctomycetes bacterium]|nr:YeeE/YedE family protein [Planctomycetota bacterium]
MNEIHQGESEPVWNPYLAGVGLGLTLLLSFVVLGTGLGASGAIARGSAALAHVVAPTAVEQNGDTGPWFQDGAPLAYYLVTMAVGVLLGGLLSAWAARRLQPQVERGPRASASLRLGLALGGGALVGFSARLAAGCTSGQALTGGALLLTGSWAFMLSLFVGGYAAAWFVRKEWL